MHNKDYIMRMIEQMGQVLIAIRRAILGQKASGSEIDSQLREVAGRIGFDLSLARAATPETIMMLVAPTGELEPGRVWMVAEVLYLDGLQAEAEDRHDDAWAAFEKALPLYRAIEPGSLFMELPEAGERLRDVENRLFRLASPADRGRLPEG